jgi:hypothetical protein
MGAITVTIGGGAALIYWRNSTARPAQAGLQVVGVVPMIAGMLARIPHYQAGYRALPVARYHPLGVEQDRAGLDELSRSPSDQKEKQALWLT